MVTFESREVARCESLKSLDEADAIRAWTLRMFNDTSDNFDMVLAAIALRAAQNGDRVFAASIFGFTSFWEL